MKTHKDLEVWKRSIDLVTEIYHLTDNFPKSEVYGLTSQIRRASVSIPANIAEGAGRHYKKEFIQFLYFSMGSLSELETLLLVAANLNYIETDKRITLESEMNLIRSMISNLIKYLKKDLTKN